MNIKRALAVLFSCTIVITTGAVSAAAYTHSYTSNYSYVDYGVATGTTTKVVKMTSRRSNPYIYTSSQNESGNSVYMETAAYTYSKTGSLKKSDVQTGVCSNHSAIVATCSDYRATSTNVYYKHSFTIWGDTVNHTSSSKISSKTVTVG